MRFAIPIQHDDTIIHHAYYRIHEHHLVATDHAVVQQQVYARLLETEKKRLAQVAAFASELRTSYLELRTFFPFGDLGSMNISVYRLIRD